MILQRVQNVEDNEKHEESVIAKFVCGGLRTGPSIPGVPRNSPSGVRFWKGQVYAKLSPKIP